MVILVSFDRAIQGLSNDTKLICLTLHIGSYGQKNLKKSKNPRREASWIFVRNNAMENVHF